MGFFDFFKPKGNVKSAQEKAAERALLKATRTLDIDIAIAAHKNWKARLEASMFDSSDETYTVEQAACDKSCDLGKWIYSDGEDNLGEYAAFVDLKAQHKMFHLTASSILGLTQAGKTDDAKKLLETDFAKLSSRVISRLEDLKGLS